MLTPTQQTTLKVTGAVLVAQAGFALAVLKRHFDIENKLMATGKVVLANIDNLNEEDLQTLRDAGLNFTK
jgi:hypothetical protein